MITASHNPAADNGYKIYWENGCQIISPHDANISRYISENLEPWCDYTQVASISFTNVTEDAVAKYMAFMTLKLHSNSNSMNEVGLHRPHTHIARSSHRLHSYAWRRFYLCERLTGALPSASHASGGRADQPRPHFPDCFIPQPRGKGGRFCPLVINRLWILR